MLLISIGQCMSLSNAETKTEFGTIKDTSWLVQEVSHETPGCEWLRAHNVIGIERPDTYEITTEELCDLGTFGTSYRLDATNK
jgi:hypothetical protein